jgi:murein DD-endopeptidase MepM/ murein hydrolase activator NlpD
MHRWLNLFKKPEGRAARHPRTLQIVVALSGHPARSLSLNLDTLKKAAMALGLAAFSWFAVTFYIAYSHVSNMAAIAQSDAQAERIATLQENNARLDEERQRMGERLINLQGRVEGLAAKMHGLVHASKSRFPVEQDARVPMGGPAMPITEANAERMMQEGLAAVDERFSSLLPALESTLEREAVRPVGVPVTGVAEVSSNFGLRANPFGRGHEFHAGMDFPGDTGTPVVATAPGKVDQAGRGGALGNHIAIDHGYGYRSIYGHLSKVMVKSGDAISKGQVIGLVGNTGRSSGPHLHYALQYQGRTINPAPYVQ